MLIGSKIKPTRSATRTQSIEDVDYVFADHNKDGHFVAEVKNTRHVELFLGTGHFYIYDNKPKLSRGQAPAGGLTAEQLAEQQRLAKVAADEQEASNKAAADAAKAAADAAAEEERLAAAAKLAELCNGFEPAVVQQAQTLLAVDAKKMATEVGKASGKEVIQCALVIEEAASEPRKPVVKVLTDTLSLMNGQ